MLSVVVTLFATTFVGLLPFITVSIVCDNSYIYNGYAVCMFSMVDGTYGNCAELIDITLNGVHISAINGFAQHPVTRKFYLLGSDQDIERVLFSIDEDKLLYYLNSNNNNNNNNNINETDLTTIAYYGYENITFSSITFGGCSNTNNNGEILLYAITGTASKDQKLYTIDYMNNGELTLLYDLIPDTSEDGNSVNIVYSPFDKYIYRVTGLYETTDYMVISKIDLDNGNEINVTFISETDTGYESAQGLDVYDENTLIIITINDELLLVDISGEGLDGNGTQYFEINENIFVDGEPKGALCIDLIDDNNYFCGYLTDVPTSIPSIIPSSIPTSIPSIMTTDNDNDNDNQLNTTTINIADDDGDDGDDDGDDDGNSAVGMSITGVVVVVTIVGLIL